jgi:hypothetical protein
MSRVPRPRLPGADGDLRAPRRGQRDRRGHHRQVACPGDHGPLRQEGNETARQRRAREGARGHHQPRGAPRGAVALEPIRKPAPAAGGDTLVSPRRARSARLDVQRGGVPTEARNRLTIKRLPWGA